MMYTIAEIYFKILMDEEINWKEISRDNLTEDFMEEFRTKLYWPDVCMYNTNLTEKFIHRFSNFVYWPFVFVWQELSEEFIEQHKKYLDPPNWLFIYIYQNVSEEFLLKHKKELHMITSTSKFCDDIEFQKKFTKEI